MTSDTLEQDGLAVVKLGGSLLASPRLDELLAVCARENVVVAPGGGPFADAVRAAQGSCGTSDAAAHRMAILAMEQTAILLADRAPFLSLAATEAEFAGARASGRGAIWLPSALAFAAPLPASWDVTSDTLALWLAKKLRASRLVLLKSAGAPHGTGPADWVRLGLVDAAFEGVLEQFTGDVELVGPASAAGLEHALRRTMRRAA